MTQPHHRFRICRYERSRTVPTSVTVYHVNVHTVLDDVCYKLSYAPNSCELAIQLVEPDKTEGIAGMEGYLTDYIK